jgi:hypothetical protein
MEKAMKYVKRPVVVEAVQLDHSPMSVEAVMNLSSSGADIICEHDGCESHQLRIKTLEGDMIARPGDYIIRGVRGELYPCKPDIFEATYSPYDGD